MTEDACHSLRHGGHPIKDSGHTVPLTFSLFYPAEAFSKSFSQRSKVFLNWFLPWKNWDLKEDPKGPQISGLCKHCLPCAILHTTKQLSRCSYVDRVPPSLSVGPCSFLLPIHPQEQLCSGPFSISSVCHPHRESPWLLRTLRTIDKGVSEVPRPLLRKTGGLSPLGARSRPPRGVCEASGGSEPPKCYSLHMELPSSLSSPRNWEGSLGNVPENIECFVLLNG